VSTGELLHFPNHRQLLEILAIALLGDILHTLPYALRHACANRWVWASRRLFYEDINRAL